MKSRYIQLEEGSCHNCMRCVRACPTHAMTYIHNEPRIEAEECILCGRCYSVCPHDAKQVLSEVLQVRRWLDNGEQVILSVAPSFTAVWPKFAALERILIGRGFSIIAETARGASLVSQSFANLIQAGNMKNIITTCCPAVDELIEKEYGDLTPYMAPVVSPLIAHGRSLKKQYPDAKVVFLSPCIAKFKEIEDARFAGAVDACIGMEEVADWIKNDLSDSEKDDWESFEGSISRLYPTAGGIIATLEKDPKYKYVAVDGVEEVKEVLDALREGTFSGYFFEMNSCRGACLGGPLMSHFHHNQWLGQSVIRENVNEKDKIKAGPIPLDLTVEWHKEDIFRPHHTEEEINAEMIAMGKTSPDRIHDCGACGYETCRLKAIAVLDGKADPKICMPEALAHAQSLSNVVIENTPNGIVILDNTYSVKEMNPSARALLNLEMINPTGMPVQAVLPDDALNRLIHMTGRKTEYIRVWYDNYQKLIDHAIVKIQDEPYT
ncbi:MAG: 4Fe-4S dicluster domain-containing protein, partial [Erysipelotrichia bacterium]|nr:4Fe-4S dicluster domain-containing protein [Erysipelotrichia bacterium]